MKLYESTPISASKFALNFRYNQTILNLDQQNKNDMFYCDCMQWIEDRSHLCPHLVYSLDHVTRESFLSTWDDDGNGMKNALECNKTEHTRDMIRN